MKYTGCAVSERFFNAQLEDLDVLRPGVGHLGCGRIVASETEAPNMLAKIV
jgi:hypothetical protein